MADNIIQKESVEEHAIQRYRFKVLGGGHVGQVEDAEAQPQGVAISDPFEESFEPEPIVRQESGNHFFVEELLKKTDELTTHVVKLQLQIEKQENEFTQRLNEELKRERESAHIQGYQKAKEELEASVSEVKARYVKSMNQLEAFCASMEEKLIRLESEAGAIALEIAKEVIKKEASKESGQIALLLSKELLKELKDATKIELHVNPNDAEMIKAEYAQHEKIKIVPDDAITLGGVVVLSDIGNLDGTLAMRLEKVKYMIQEN